MHDTVRRRRGPALLAGLLAGLLLIVLQPAGEALAATFDVTQTAYAADANLGDSLCDVDTTTAGNQCSLRAAVQTANALGGSHVIRLPAGATSVEFTVQRQVQGQPTTVPITVVDGCGEWKTFGGGGALAGF